MSAGSRVLGACSAKSGPNRRGIKRFPGGYARAHSNSEVGFHWICVTGLDLSGQSPEQSAARTRLPDSATEREEWSLLGASNRFRSEAEFPHPTRLRNPTAPLEKIPGPRKFRWGGGSYSATAT